MSGLDVATVSRSRCRIAMVARRRADRAPIQAIKAVGMTTSAASCQSGPGSTKRRRHTDAAHVQDRHHSIVRSITDEVFPLVPVKRAFVTSRRPLYWPTARRFGEIVQWED